jgi:outer membrane murein-binding lipoprotein Lpp
VSRRWWVLATPVAPVVASLLLAACSSGTPGDITVAGERVLQPAVQHVREVASTHNYDELRAAVAQLKSLVRQEQAKGDVSASRGVAIEDAADKLVEDASPSPSPTPSPTTTSPTPTPTTTSATPTPTPTPTPSLTTEVSTSATPGEGNGNGGGIIPSG